MGELRDDVPGHALIVWSDVRGQWACIGRSEDRDKLVAVASCLLDAALFPEVRVVAVDSMAVPRVIRFMEELETPASASFEDPDSYLLQ